MKKPIIVLLHLGYWLLYTFLLLIIFLLLKAGVSSASHVREIRVEIFLMIWFFGFVPAVPAFYIFYFTAFDRFLQKRKIITLILAAIFVSIICGLASCLLLPVFFKRIVLFNDGLNSAISICLTLALIAFLNGTVSLFIRGFISWYTDIRIKEELKSKNLEIELALIKSKINPHFLFNTLNNIDVLIEMEPAKASAYLNKLSDILRFMLYDTRSDKIPLGEELQTIEKYIDLQKIRTEHPERVKYCIEGDTNNWSIEPMLFLPFIENAFKYAEKNNSEKTIAVSIKAESDKIIFNCSNSFQMQHVSDKDYGGIGNDLMKKRLDLLYPDRYQLDISHDNGLHRVTLILFKNGNQVRNS